MLSVILVLVVCILGVQVSGGFPRQERVPRRWDLGDGLQTFGVRQTASPAPSPSSIGSSINFNTIPSMTTCSSTSITWSYVGPSGQNLSIDIRQATVGTTALVASNLDPASGQYNWSHVTVPEGWYIFVGVIVGVEDLSPTFFVQNGSDTSCLSAVTPLPPTLTAGMPTSSYIPPSSSAVLSDASSSSKSKTGAIVGGVLGGIALIAVICVALLFVRSRRGRSPKGSRNGRWGGLNSVDSSIGKSHVTSTSRNREVEAVSNIPPVTESRNDPEFRSDISHEKLFISNIRASPVSHSPPTSYSNPFEDGASSTRQSVKRTSNNSTVYSYSQDPGSLSPVSPIGRPESMHVQGASYDSDTVQPPPRRSSLNARPPSVISKRRQTPTYPTPQVEMERIPSASNGKVGVNKTPRKPVPKYVESSEALADLDPRSNSPNDSAISESPVSSLVPEASDPKPKLVHHNSFGELKLQKPVHYLVPDMPLPPKD